MKVIHCDGAWIISRGQDCGLVDDTRQPSAYFKGNFQVPSEDDRFVLMPFWCALPGSAFKFSTEAEARAKALQLKLSEE